MNCNAGMPDTRMRTSEVGCQISSACLAKAAKSCENGGAFIRKGEPEFAACEYKQAVETLLSAGEVAADSPQLATAKVKLYRAYIVHSVHHRALSSFKAAPDSDSGADAECYTMFPGVGGAHERLAFVKDALRIRLLHHQQGDLEVAEARHWYAWELMFNRRCADAAEQADAARRVRKAVLGPTHKATVAAGITKAFALVGMDKSWEAGAALERLESATREVFGVNSAEHAALKLGMAQCAMRAGVNVDAQGRLLLRERIDSIQRLEPSFKVPLEAAGNAGDDGADTGAAAGRAALMHFLAMYARSGKLNWVLEV